MCIYAIQFSNNLNGFVYAVNFFLVVFFSCFWSPPPSSSFLLSTNQKTMKYRFVHGIIENQCALFIFNFYANYVISFKIFMLSNFKHEFCMSHIILWQRRWLQKHQQQHSAAKKQVSTIQRKFKYQKKKCVCVECVLCYAVASLFKIHLN